MKTREQLWAAIRPEVFQWGHGPWPKPAHNTGVACGHRGHGLHGGTADSGGPGDHMLRWP
jgi:hypothetical protein